MSDEYSNTPEEIIEEDSSSLNEEEERILEGYLKKKQEAEPSKFTVLYVIVALISVLTISYLYHAILDLTLTNKINAALYLIIGGITVFILSESYKGFYDFRQIDALSGSNGKWVRDLEERRIRRHASIPENTQELKVPGGALGLSAKEIYIRTQKGSEEGWKKLGKAERQVYASQEAIFAVKYLGHELAEVKNLLYQQSMGFALLLVNSVFIALALLLAFSLRNYDNRVSFVFSTIVNSILTSLFISLYQNQVKDFN